MGWVLDPAIFPWAALVLGLAVGSFLNVVIYRLPRMMDREWISNVPEVLDDSPALKGHPDLPSTAQTVRAMVESATKEPVGLLAPRSHCPGCKKLIPFYRNVPVLSYAFQRGKCAECGTRIGLQYPLVEILAGLGAAYCAYRFGFGLKAIAAALFVWAVIALSFIDQKTGFLPDDITLPLMWIGLLSNVWGAFVPLPEAVLGAAAGYMVLWSVNALFRAIRGMDGMGYGDFKMTAAVGALLGWKALLMVILLSSLVGAVFGTAQMIAARRGVDWQFKFHFGPYIAIAGVIALFWGHPLAAKFPGLRPFG